MVSREIAVSRRSLREAVYLHQYHIFEVAQACLKIFLEDVSNAERLHPLLEGVPAF
jgi:hypothetical protein